MTRRSYQQNCALAIALDLIGERWTLLIIRELLLGQRRFGQLQQNLTGIGTNLLSARLSELCEAGLIERDESQGHPRYRLSALGRGLEPTIHELIRWGMYFHERRDPGQTARPEWNLLALRALSDPEQAPGSGVYRVVIDDVTLQLRYEEGRPVECPEAVEVLAEIRMDSKTAARLAAGELSPEQAREAGRLEVEGEPSALEAFFRAFPAPAGG